MREEEESKQREEVVKERERKISSLRAAQDTDDAGARDRADWEEQRRQDAVEEEERSHGQSQLILGIREEHATAECNANGKLLSCPDTT